MNCNGCHWFESSGCIWVLTVHAPRHAATGKGEAENSKGHDWRCVVFMICLW